jgi:hypothetical protein
MQIRKVKIIKSEKHRRFVASYSCIICKSPNVQCAHIRSIPKYGNVGMAVRNDAFCVPLCISHHAEQHLIGENKFYFKYSINPIYISEMICKDSPCKKIQSLPEGFFDEYRQYTKTHSKGYV